MYLIQNHADLHMKWNVQIHPKNVKVCSYFSQKPANYFEETKTLMNFCTYSTLFLYEKMDPWLHRTIAKIKEN